eukprot:Platyproteum_vivax@DN7088_c0_g1_i4.p1
MSHHFRHYFNASSTIKYKTAFQNTVSDVLASRGWIETDSDTDWDLHWCERDGLIETFANHVQAHQRVNHYTNYYELTRKDLIIKHLKKLHKKTLKEKGEEEGEKFNVYPTTFVLPSEYGMFVDSFRRQEEVANESIWIMKPVGKSQGRGIFLINKIADISGWKNERIPDPTDEEKPSSYIVQQYIVNPLLLGGRKFDIRLYVLVTSFWPLTFWLYRSGFARFSSCYYSSEHSQLQDQCIHLTNVSIQKQADTYNRSSGGKWDLNKFKLYMLSRFGYKKTTALFLEMQSVITHSLLAVQHAIINDGHSFEVYGYDVIIDANFKVWLLEVNCSPSLSANTADDYSMKFGVIDDALTIVDLEQ